MATPVAQSSTLLAAQSYLQSRRPTPAETGAQAQVNPNFAQSLGQTRDNTRTNSAQTATAQRGEGSQTRPEQRAPQQPAAQAASGRSAPVQSQIRTADRTTTSRDQTGPADESSDRNFVPPSARNARPGTFVNITV